MSKTQPEIDKDNAEKRLDGRRVALAGRLAGMSKRDAQKLVRQHGGVAVERAAADVDIVVVGEQELPLGNPDQAEGLLDEAVRAAAEAGTLEIISETQLWQRLGLVEEDTGTRRLYTPAMLADLLGVPVAVIRRWHRRRLIRPVREVRRLPYFDFKEVAAARRLAQWLAAGVKPAAIEKKLAEMARFLPGVERPLDQLSIIVQGKELLLRQGDGLVEPGGQYRFDFEAAEKDETEKAVTAGRQILSLSRRAPAAGFAGLPTTGEEMLHLAAELDDEGHLDMAAEMYRAVLAAAGPNAEVNFRLAELLYRTGDLGAARERYFAAIELDEDYVEARANLGCVLAEMGQRELAVAAFEGALAYYNDYPDAHYHLARTLDELDRGDEAEMHWRAFLALASDSPWADVARTRLEEE